MEDKIKITALFFSKQRVIGNPQLDRLLELDDLWTKIYNEHRRYGFSEASLLANETVIREIFKKEN